MIILASNGLSSAALLREAGKFVLAQGKAAIITTASLGYKEKDWHIPRLTKELKQLGLSVAYFDFDFEDVEALLSYDVVEILGGNPFHLLKHLQLEKNKAVLRKIAEKKNINRNQCGQPGFAEKYQARRPIQPGNERRSRVDQSLRSGTDGP